MIWGISWGPITLRPVFMPGTPLPWEGAVCGERGARQRHMSDAGVLKLPSALMLLAASVHGCL